MSIEVMTWPLVTVLNALCVLSLALTNRRLSANGDVLYDNLTP